MSPLVLWLVKALASYAINYLVKKLGHTEAGEHITASFENAKKLNPDPLPSPASLRRPQQFPDE